MERFDRRTFIKTTGLLGTAGITGLAGCSGGPGGDDTTTESGGSGGGETDTTTEAQTSEASTSTAPTSEAAATETSAMETSNDTGTATPASSGESTEATVTESESGNTTGMGTTEGNATGGNATGGNATNATAGSAGGTTRAETTNVGMVYATGGLGDGSFNDQAQQGVKQAKKEFNVEYGEAQPDAVADFSNFQQQFAKSSDPDYDLVTCVGFLQADALKKTAPNYADQKFQIIDDSSVKADNVASYVFGEHEGSFLVGVLASMLTSQDFEAGAGKTNPDNAKVGFVGGVESGLIARFEAGFKAGVQHTNSDIDVQTTYVGDFNDPSGGKTAADSMYSSGVDIVYHAAGNTGTGVFQSAQSQSRYAIGVDRDQSKTRPKYKDVILASMVKRVDTAVYNAIKGIINGKFNGGEATALGLEQDGVAAVYGQQLGSEIPKDIKSAVSDARSSIIDGDIDVPTDPSNV